MHMIAAGAATTLSGMSTGETVREARQKLGMSQADLGARIGISQAAIQKIEKGSTVNTRHVAFAISWGSLPPSWVQIPSSSPPANLLWRRQWHKLSA